MNKKPPKQPFHEVVAERLIEQLKQGTAPWQKPWVPGHDNHSLPYNPSTGKRYRGINTLNLMSQGFSDPRWMTYDQANSVNAQVIKGAKSTPVQYWKFNEEQKLLDDNGKPILDSQGKAKTVIVPLERPRVFFASVFNAEQIEGLPPIEIKPQTAEQTWDAVNRAEKILASSGANIMHKSQNRAFYSPGNDSITLPEKNQFSDAAGYYATALHELGHWTGHPSRLNRDLGHPFGSEAYAKEELRAEISSMIMGEELGIGHNPEQHTAYVKSWIKVLQDDPLEIFRAAADAEKIQTLLLSYEQKQVQNVEQDLNAEAYESWGNLKGYANDLGLKAELTKSNDAEADFKITYSAKNGELPIYTALLNGDGKAATYVNGERVPGTNFTTADEWQGQALEAALSTVVTKYIETATKKLELATESPIGMDTETRAVSHLALALIGVKNGDIPASALSIVGQTLPFREIVDEGLKINPKWIGETHIMKPNFGKEPEDPRFHNDSEHYSLMLSLSDNGKVWDVAANFKTLDAAQSVEKLLLSAVNQSQTQDNQAHNLESQSMDKKTEKVFIDVPFKEKDEAKAAGARWDRSAGYWSIDKSELSKLNDKWPVVQVEAKPETKLFIAVPYSEKDEAKRIGAKWDKHQKSWYVDPNTDKKLIDKWLVENRPTEQAPALTPREELALVMKEMGFDVTGEHPIMDGKKHRCRLLSDKASVKDQSGGGMYVAFTDGIPAAYISNNRTGESQNWSSKGYSMTNEEKAVLNAQAAAKKQEREAAQAAEHQSVGEGITRLLEVCNLPTGNEKYLQVKQAKAGNLLVIPEPSALPNDPKVLIGANWRESQALREKNPSHVVFTTGDLVVPAHDANGKIWTAQTIQPNGTKMFPSGSQKTGSFHIVGGDMDALAKSPVIIVSEGYATADTLSEAAVLPVVSAFDAGNLVTVAKALREIHPNKPMLICGDNDAHQVMTEGKNVGVEKATAAAEAVKGQTLFPIFAPKEQLYPPELPIVTPELWRNKEVTKEQMKAIDTMKKYTDFNDVKTKSVLGIDGVKRQVKFAINELLNKQNLQHTQKQEQEQTQEQNTKKSHVKTRSASPA
ncbi:zincin-like metallopeptidase domain-containing protein [Shewanella sp. ZOR0012]|uniref:zincin-like metallopeptidase domain-containing protein n=1 Tax=Shewanella sp. ZOR0012 TaxID=1339231 RepID=UPI000646A2AD|nr:zincin-like metallopeptidase domain-containing protein [Shewanella sp. ZOR0012]